MVGFAEENACFWSDRHHMQSMKIASQEETSRFWSKLEIATQSKCWNWKGAVSKNGYGSFKFDGVAVTASRLAYFLWYNKDPGSMMVLHTCDNRRCCNPHHLYLGDVKQNSRDMVERGRHRTGPVVGSGNGNAKLTEADVMAIRAMFAAGKTNIEIAARYGVKHQTISKIRRGYFWKHVQNGKGEAA